VAAGGATAFTTGLALGLTAKPSVVYLNKYTIPPKMVAWTSTANRLVFSLINSVPTGGSVIKKPGCKRINSIVSTAIIYR
jgi:hypothetical protein